MTAFLRVAVSQSELRSKKEFAVLEMMIVRSKMKLQEAVQTEDCCDTVRVFRIGRVVSKVEKILPGYGYSTKLMHLDVSVEILRMSVMEIVCSRSGSASLAKRPCGNSTQKLAAA